MYQQSFYLFGIKNNLYKLYKIYNDINIENIELTVISSSQIFVVNDTEEVMWTKFSLIASQRW